MVHGVAGSAPLLAVLPALFQKNYTAAGAYSVLFSLCVCLAMCLFGGLFGRLSHSVFKRLDRGFIYLQRFLGLQAIGFGVYWISLAI